MYNARYYDPIAGRFTQPDTIVPGGGADPQHLNRYSYVRNNPVRYADPTGHETCDVDTGACWDEFEDALFGSPYSSTRSNDEDVIADFLANNGWTGFLFDVGRDAVRGASNLKADGFQSQEDFKSIVGSSAPVLLRRAAENILDREKFHTRLNRNRPPKRGVVSRPFDWPRGATHQDPYPA